MISNFQRTRDTRGLVLRALAASLAALLSTTVPLEAAAPPRKVLVASPLVPPGPALVPGDPATNSLTFLLAGGAGEPLLEVRAKGATEWQRAQVVRPPGAGEVLSRAPALLRIDNLIADTKYEVRYRIRRSPEDAGSWVRGPLVRTAPAADAAAPLAFAWGGDVAGQNLCRTLRGYPAFQALDNLYGIANVQLDFFVALGDMIYADSPCESVGAYGDAQLPVEPPRARTLDDFRARWRYLRGDPAFGAFARRVPYVAVWDDHEVVNDFGPEEPGMLAPGATDDAPLLPAGRQAFLEFNPVPAIADAAAPARLYRSFAWGRHAEFFVLDTRSHRASAARADGAGKSMLGDEQRRWLERGLSASTATWKFVVTSVPVSIPTGSDDAPDGWADGGTGRGYEHELRGILEGARRAGVRNLVFLTTDVHFATGLKLRPSAADPNWVAYEITSGPLNAGLYPKRALDDTFGPERLYWFGPESADAVTSLEAAEKWFNFGVVSIDETGKLALAIRDAAGESKVSLTLTPEAVSKSSSRRR